MEKQSGNASRAGGAIIAFAILIGAFVGTTLGEPSAGTLIGTAIGLTIAIALYIHDRRRR